MIDAGDQSSMDDAVDFQVKKFKKELNAGTSALILLNILNASDEPLYGYQIAKKLEQHSKEKHGAIYPVLRNLSAKGLLVSHLVPSPSGPARKYFEISPLGKAVLREWLNIWHQTKDMIELSINDNADEDS